MATTLAVVFLLATSPLVPSPSGAQPTDDSAVIDQAVPEGAEAINRIILRVNDEIVTLVEYERRKGDQIRGLLANPNVSNQDRQERLARVGQETMQQLYRETLIAARARSAGYSTSERDIDDAMRDVMSGQGIETVEELEAALAEAGMTLDSLRENLRQELIVGQVIRRDVTNRIEVPDDEVRAFYRNNQDRFEIPEKRKLVEVIVLDDGIATDEDLQALAATVRAELEAADDRAAAVAGYSERGLTTGVLDLGWLRRDELGEELAGAAFTVEPGVWSEPVEARGGLHLIFVEDLEERQMRSFEEVEEQIRARERQVRFGSQLRTFLAELEESSYVREDLPPDAVGFRALGDLEIEREDELEDFRAPLEALSGDAAAEPSTEDPEALEEVEPADPEVAPDAGDSSDPSVGAAA
ncbi:MAG: peptidyl-prolyl cis-trans isomerase [Acidobacteriota bacterium]